MQLIGYSDLSLKQIFKILEKTPVKIDSKLFQKFSLEKYQSKNIQAKVMEVKIEDNSEEIFNRSLLLYLTCFIFQEKNYFSIETLKRLVDSLNGNVKSYDIKIPYLWTDDQLNQEEKSLLLDNSSKIQENTLSLATQYFFNQIYKLHIVENCVFLECNKIGFNFLGEIEKGNYENRKIAKTVNLYKNFFKAKTSTKSQPEISFVNDIYLSYELQETLHELKTSVVENFKYQESQLISGEVLSTFMNMSRKQTFKHLELLLNDLVQVSKDRISLKISSNCVFENVVEIYWQLFYSIYQQVCITQKKFLEIVAKNNKVKNTYSDSYKELAEFFKISTKSEELNINTFMNEYRQSFNNINLVLSQALEPMIVINKKPKAPKGTRDSLPLQMQIKQKAIKMIQEVYKQHGAVEIDTPVFELKETLLGKYGEEGGKLIYDLEDQGGELLSLRYDLTVPFARFMGSNNLKSLKRFHIGKVYRRDQPVMNKGRFREFYQCDFDIAGRSDGMLADAEVLLIMVKILKNFDLNFEIKLSHRMLLEAIIECSNCDIKKFKAICSSIDKLDKEPWEKVAEELFNEKGISESSIQLLKTFVLNKGSIFDLIKQFENSKIFGENEKAKNSLNELLLLGQHLEILGCYDSIKFDCSLARGLDYYTGIIFEAVLTDGANIGSIGGGGRYDGLIGMFSKHEIPSIGMSIGIERLFVILEQKQAQFNRECDTEVLVASVGKNLTKERLKVLDMLWKEGIKAEMIYEENPKPDKQLKKALSDKTPLIVWIGESELKENSVKIKKTNENQEEMVKLEELVDYIKQYLKLN